MIWLLSVHYGEFHQSNIACSHTKKEATTLWPRDGPNALGHQVPSSWLRVGKVSAPRQSGDHAKTVIVDLPSKLTFWHRICLLLIARHQFHHSFLRNL